MDTTKRQALYGQLMAPHLTKDKLKQDFEGFASFVHGLLSLHFSSRRLTFEGFIPENVQRFLNDLIGRASRPTPTKKDCFEVIDSILKVFENRTNFLQAKEFTDRNLFYLSLTNHLNLAMKCETAPFIKESLVDEIKKVLNERLTGQQKNVLENFYGLRWFKEQSPMSLGHERLRQIREKALIIGRLALTSQRLIVFPEDQYKVLSEYRATVEKLKAYTDRILNENARLRAENEMHAKNAPLPGKDKKTLESLETEELITSTGISVKLLRTSIEKLGLGTREINCLKAGHVNTLAEIIQEQEEDLLKFRHFGKRTLNIVKQMLESKGLALNTKILPEDLTLIKGTY